ncbi:hypothetical protein BJ508DRAFT_412537 [Ascobolus immersus RN42]|uniref:AA9 family lytic polysaccharide monooxygenase n=1 Tax=Ascobolus immersus RN42 TaxID=1160509 RepID=A0A3N4IGQ0_ASCIM|nr:hypothetical protein BJ508DRAFT_412537 [Ascobolus immersus RN42]
MKLTIPTVLAIFASSSTLVSGHATFQYINDQSAPVRKPPTNNPVMDVSSQTLACNVNGGNAAQSTLSVQAGSTVTLEWHHDTRSSQAIDPSHKGPVITYLAKVPSAASANQPHNLNWFKIYHDGLTINGGTETWATDKLNANGGKYSHRIPSNIASGDYLLRSEVIALHAASSYPGAQFYMGCAQITVTGGSGSANPSTVKLPGAYNGNHAGIKIGIYYPKVTNYQIPGPAVFSG